MFWDGGMMMDFTTLPDNNWDQYTFTETASSATTVAQFAGRNQSANDCLDHVFADRPLTPEPASIALSIAGLAAIAMFGRVRKFAVGQI